MKKQYLIIEHRSAAALQRAHDQIRQLRQQLEDLQQQYQHLEIRYGWEVMLNNELVDLCREKGVNFRPALDRSKRPGR